jgi:hypothetical protein
MWQHIAAEPLTARELYKAYHQLLPALVPSPPAPRKTGPLPVPSSCIGCPYLIPDWRQITFNNLCDTTVIVGGEDLYKWVRLACITTHSHVSMSHVYYLVILSV